VLVSLGVWQLQRKAWKEGVIVNLSERLAAQPVPLASRAAWPQLERNDMEFRRVSFRAEFLHDQEALVYAFASAFRSDVAGPGYWIFTPARLMGGGIVVVNRGFVPEGRRDSATRREGQITGVITIVGALRWPEERGRFTPADNPQQNLWFVRDHIAMARAKGWDPVAPFYLEQESPSPPGGLPKPGTLHANLVNNHLQYALTWFGLAICLLLVFLIWARQRLPSPP